MCTLAVAIATLLGNPRAANAQVAIIIDDLGNLRGEGLRALELPGPITFGLLPHTPYAAELAELAHALGKEVIVHLPMEARSGKAMGPGGLSRDFTKVQLQHAVRQALDAVPGAVGVSNHMGSLLTAMPDRMDWLMEALRTQSPLYFIDSHTHAASVAYTSARRFGVAAGRRDVFLDHDRDPKKIERQLGELVRIARTYGKSIGIGHPYAETIAVLERRLPALQAASVEFATVSSLLRAPDKEHSEELASRFSRIVP